ncbi:GNAT family N-acetyltransferase [Aquibacillus saliphilus]|uniref:GNAT family N-acetyltransferase n=1 Tax=Aquibacillus saliphilus TaxID=1909422 RepID=UPI001CEFDF6D|nr:GNAT family N-acetyltransferase [Aquibacillus saliphilus]
MKIDKQWVQADSDFIKKKVIEHNLQQLSKESKTPFENTSFVLRDDEENIVGGVTATMYWFHMHIDFLWVKEELRHYGYGSTLMNEIKELAIVKGCRFIILDTFSFQAPGFYRKLGYEVIGIVEDHPKGHNQYYMKKDLII